MSMSTNIADLPGPSEVQHNFEEDSYEPEYEEEYDNVEHLEPQQEKEVVVPPKELYEQPSSIKMDIKKVQKRKEKLKENDDDMFELIKKEVSEENILILIVLYIASTSLLDDYARKILSMISFNITSFSMNIVKAIGLLVVFIIAKNVLLPYIKI